MASFDEMLKEGYGFTDPSVTLGAALEGSTVHQEPKIRVPLAVLNRHGLIAGATGTGKTKTLQLMAEQMSAQGIPVFAADIKGDLSGIAMPGAADDRVTGRAKDVGYAWKPAGSPVEFVSLSGKLGVQLRATVSSFGPLLLAKVLGLNDTQTGVLSMVFKYADDQQLPLLDFADLRAVLQLSLLRRGQALAGPVRRHAGQHGRGPAPEHGRAGAAGCRAVLRRAGVRREGPAKVTSDGRGVITCLELSDVQDKPALFSTFMMWLLAELYHNLPEVGDVAKPKLAFFFDEAHLLFDSASKAFVEQIEQTVRLIRSKGVGVYLVTQSPRTCPTRCWPS